MTGPTNKFVDSVDTMHIVGELRNDGTRTLNVYQMVATTYGLNNQTLGLDYATLPDTISPGQSASFEFLVARYNYCRRFGSHKFFMLYLTTSSSKLFFNKVTNNHTD